MRGTSHAGVTVYPVQVNLHENIERLKLAVDQILPLHGRKVPLTELQKWIGKAS
jgi:hypothetical protein